MSTVTPRRSMRVPHMHTPKMSERKKGLFQVGEEHSRESLTQHRALLVVNSDSESDDCDLGIVGTLDSSSGEDYPDNGANFTPERKPWHETRSHTRRLLKETHELKNFLKSPFTLKKYQNKYPHPDAMHSSSTPATPHFSKHPGTPSSTHSCASAHTVSSTSSRARKNLASLIADTESCSSSLKDLNFDTDSGGGSKENSPSKHPRRSSRKQVASVKKTTFKGVLMEQKTINGTFSPAKSPIVCLTKMDMNSILSPTQMLKTPHSAIESTSPKVHNRRPVLEIAQSPEDNDMDKPYKRLRNESFVCENEPNSKHPKLDMSGPAPKARLSLFGCDRLKEMLSAKSFYGKSYPGLNTSFTTRLTHALAETVHTQKRHYTTSSHKHKSRKSGQINLGVRHKIRKPKINKSRILLNRSGGEFAKASGDNQLNNSTISNNDVSLLSQNSSQDPENDRTDPFNREKQTIDALLSQWTEEEVPESEVPRARPEVRCFNSTIIEETSQIFQPMTAVPVVVGNIAPDSEVIVELGTGKAAPSPVEDVLMKESESHADVHGDAQRGFLPVEGGYIVVDDNVQPGQEELTDLDAIERELRMLDEQILQMAQSNNIDGEAVLASTESAIGQNGDSSTPNKEDKSKLFPIFNNPNPGTSTSKDVQSDNRRPLLKNGSKQYVIDAGQKKFGATQCTECGVIYEIGDPQDEHDHLVHHNATDVLRFNGWKDERVVGTWGTARCLCVRGGDSGWKRVEAILARIVHPQLGYGATLNGDLIYSYSAYLYIEKKQIIGCLVVEPKVKAYKLIPGDPDCCSVEVYPVKCGVSRVWTHKSHRGRGVARRMLDCARASFLYGQGVRLEEIAFSAPTAAGKALATKYCGTPNFYVYLE